MEPDESIMLDIEVDITSFSDAEPVKMATNPLLTLAPDVPPHAYLTMVQPNWEPDIGPTDCAKCSADLGDDYADFSYCPYCGAEL